MRRRVSLGVIVLLLLTIVSLLIVDHTPLGLRLRYGKSADPNVYATEPLVKLQKSLFPEPGYQCVGTSSDRDTVTTGRRETARVFHYTFLPDETRTNLAILTDARPELLSALRRLSDAAQAAGFALVPGGFDAGSFGPHEQREQGGQRSQGGQQGGQESAESAPIRPDLKWPYEMVCDDGVSLAHHQLVLSGRDRFAYATLTFAQRDNLALTFSWTLVLDADTGRIELFSRFSALSPVYVGRGDTPALCQLKIE